MTVTAAISDDLHPKAMSANRADKMTPMVRSLLPLVVMLIPGACSAVMIQAMGENQDFPYLTHGRDTPVVVRGNPFATGQGRFTDRVVAAMQGRDWWGQARFKAAKAPRPGNGARVVMLFNGPGQITAFKLCETPERFDSTGPAPGLRVLAAFCVDGVPDRIVEASAGGINSTQAPAFAQLIAQITLELSRQEVDTDLGESGGDN